jgi:TolA-binding protein
MVSYELTAIVGIISAAIGAAATVLTTWLSNRTQRRRESGTVSTADAQTVFQAYGQLSSMLIDLTRQTTDRLDRVVSRVDELVQAQQRLLEQQDELLRLQREQVLSLHRIENGGAAAREVAG